MMIGFTAPFMRDEFGLSKMMLRRVFFAGLAIVGAAALQFQVLSS
jgi:hypothetical protein